MAKPEKPHESMRGYFSWHLYDAMKKDENIWLITGDLGFGMFDAIRDDFGDRFINVGAAEQTMMGVAVGLALEGKIPVVYSITPFLIYRAFETIRNYVDYENLPVKLIGSGRDRDYSHDGISHWADDTSYVIGTFKNLVEYWPDSKNEMQWVVGQITGNNSPTFVSLKR